MGRTEPVLLRQLLLVGMGADKHQEPSPRSRPDALGAVAPHVPSGPEEVCSTVGVRARVFEQTSEGASGFGIDLALSAGWGRGVPSAKVAGSLICFPGRLGTRRL
ncbi:hypothetical protein GCM10009854_29370 [Saccharopolyspora halophila]|uniref:Uncharacterized protein n=1 Tax=Saccharopolyspora halophila TaxID=405551 RepID=A0ABP5TCN3_9PSEU